MSLQYKAAGEGGGAFERMKWPRRRAVERLAYFGRLLAMDPGNIIRRRLLAEGTMDKGRLEAFSDGVLAILITIMVLELKVPHSEELSGLWPLWPVLLSYVLSFIYLGIYWNNHHHMLYAASGVSGGILWANLHLLFWLSLVPFVTAWMGESHFSPTPTAVYGLVLLMAAIAYSILQWRIVRHEGHGSILAKAIGKDPKGKGSIVLYAIAIGMAWRLPWIAWSIYALVALIWLIPDPRIERMLASHRGNLHT